MRIFVSPCRSVPPIKRTHARSNPEMSDFVGQRINRENCVDIAAMNTHQHSQTDQRQTVYKWQAGSKCPFQTSKQSPVIHTPLHSTHRAHSLPIAIPATGHSLQLPPPSTLRALPVHRPGTFQLQPRGLRAGVAPAVLQGDANLLEQRCPRRDGGMMKQGDPCTILQGWQRPSGNRKNAPLEKAF